MNIEIGDGELRRIAREGKPDLLIQTGYYQDGGLHPVRIELVHVDQAEVLPAGVYEITRECLGVNREGRFGLVFGWPQKLRRVNSDGKTKAA